MDNKNKGKIVLIIILLIMVLGLSGFIIYDKLINKEVEEVEVDSKKSEKIEEKSETVKLDSTKDFVYDLVNKKIDGPAVGEKLDFILPYVNINSDYAKEMNEEILQLQKDMEDNSKGGSVGYKYYENDDILSIIIKEESPYDYVDYYTYNISKSDGKYVSNKDLLDIKNLKKDEVIKKIEDYTIKNKYADSSIEGYEHAVVDTQYFVKGILGYPMYLNDNNELCAITYYSSVAGGLAPYSFIYNINSGIEEELK